jgi:hypothetical protein
MASFTNNKKYIFNGIGNSTKCVTYSNFTICPTIVNVAVYISPRSLLVDVTNNGGSNYYCGFGPYECGSTPSGLANRYNVYNSRSMALDTWYGSQHLMQVSSWTISNLTSAITGYNVTRQVASAATDSSSTYFMAYFNLRIPVPATRTITLNMVMNDGYGYNSNYVFGYSPRADKKITYRFDSPSITVIVSDIGTVTLGFNYCQGGQLTASEGMNGDVKSWNAEYYIDKIIFEVARSSGYADGNDSGSTCSYDNYCNYDWCSANYGCTGDNSYNDSGYTY